MKKLTAAFLLLSILLPAALPACGRVPAKTFPAPGTDVTPALTKNSPSSSATEPSLQGEPFVEIIELALPCTPRYQTTVGGLYRFAYEERAIPQVKVMTCRHYEANVLGDGSEQA